MESESTKKSGQEDHILRDKFVNGDDAAYEEIYLLFVKDLFSYGLYCHAKYEIIEDAIHDIFVEIYAKRETLKNVQNLKLYLIVAFKNRLIYLLKKEKLGEELKEKHQVFVNEQGNIEEKIEIEDDKIQKNKVINTLINELNENQQEAIYLRFVEGFTVEEIALILNINYQSAKNLLHRSIKKLRALKRTVIISILLFFSLT